MLDALAAGAKVLLYAALLGCAGSVFAMATLPRSAALEQYARRLTQRGAIGTLVVAAVCALLLYFQLGGSGDDPALNAVFASGRGAALCLQVVGALLLLVMPGDAEPRSGIRLSNAALLPASLAISGHAATAGLLNALVVLVHASAAAWWIGSLVLLRRCWAQDEGFAEAVKAFSACARKVVLALVVAGIVLVATLVDFSAEGLFTPYVGLLFLKILLAASVLAIANDNRWRLASRVLAGDTSSAAALCRRIDVELALIALVLVVTSVLTSYTTPA